MQVRVRVARRVALRERVVEAVTSAALALALLLAPVAAFAGVAVVERIDAGPPPDREALEGLAILPADSLVLLLDAAGEPELLRRLATLQVRASERVRLAVAELAPHQQAVAWRMLARPDLVEPLYRARSRAEVEELLAGVDDATWRAGLELAADERAVLAELAGLQEHARGELEGLLVGRPLGVQSKLRLLSADPAAMAFLASEPRLAVSVGALYRRNPGATLAALEDIAKETVARHRQALPGWKPDAEPVQQVAVAPRRDDAGDAAVGETVTAVGTFPVVRTVASTTVIPVAVGPASVPTWERVDRPVSRRVTISSRGAAHPLRELSRHRKHRLEERKLRAAKRSANDARRDRFRPRGRLGPDTGARTGMRVLHSRGTSRAFNRYGGGRR